jgi:predicted transposase/invertase (TIGR01784 family)
VKPSAPSEGPPSSPHDAAFKAAFQKRAVAKAFFRQYFPKRIADRIDFRRLKLRNRSYVDEKLREKHSDIVYETRIRDRTAFLYILFEHQSAPDFWIVFRLLCYMVNLWREYLEGNPGAKTLPPVLPAVLYHGERHWNAPRRLSEIVEADGDLSPYLPDFAYDLYDLGDYADESLLLGDSMALGVVLYLMKHIHDADFPDRFTQAAQYLGTIGDRKVQLEFLEWMLRYAYHAREDEKEAIDRGLTAFDDENARRIAMTIAERLRQEGMEKGLEKGLEKGVTIGKINSIHKLLGKRFGAVPPSVQKRLENATMETLDRFLEDLLDFDDLQSAERWWEKRGASGNA